MTDPTTRDLIQRLADALQWFIDEDDTNRGDNSEDGGVNWEEENAYWIAGLERGESVAAEARAYLATPEPVARPTDEELLELWTAWNVGWDPRRGLVVMPHPAEYSRAVLARYGHQTPQPIPLPERQPGPEDCDAEGRCWVGMWNECDGELIPDWELSTPANYTWKGVANIAGWLPANALPLPPE